MDLKEFVGPAIPPVGAQRVPVLSSIKARLSPVLPMKPQMVMPSQATTANGFSGTKDTNLRSNNDGIETIRVTDMTSSALFPKSFGNIFNTINKSVSTAFSNLISTGDHAAPAADPGPSSHGSQLAPGTQPFLGGGGDSGGGLLARFQSLSPIASRRNIPTCTGVPMTAAMTRPPGLVASSSSAACSVTPQVPQVRSYPPSPLPQPWTPPARPQQVNSTPAIGVTESGAFQSVADKSLQPQSIPTGESMEVN